MKSNELNIIKPIERHSTLARFGGDSFLPQSLDWPINSNGEKLTLIFSIPADFLNDNCGLSLEKEKFISVFSTYNEDYFLDEVIDNGDMSEEDKIFNDFTKVILHEKGEPRNESDFLISPYQLEVDRNVINKGKFTKIGGSPSYLQNKVLTAENLNFCFQFYAENLPEHKNILFLEDAVGYLFISNQHPFQGIFFGQCT